MRNLMKVGLLAFVGSILLLGTACTTRYITTTEWMSGSYQTLYVAYWEGACGGATCANGDVGIKQCVLNAKDNSMVCKDAPEAVKALNP